MKKNRKIILLALSLSVLLVACSGGQKANTNKGAEGQEDDKKIVLGLSPVPHGEIVEALKPQIEAEGIELEVVTFDDYIQPNEQLASGDLDANFFQHKPYLEEFTEQNKMDLVSVGPIHIEPIGFYSDKIKSLDDLKEGDEVIIPNDPTNGGRALIILDKAGLITLKDNTNLSSTENDIVENSKKLVFKPMDAQGIPNVYKDAALAAINSNFAIGAGLNPSKDAIVTEEKDSPYANILVVRKGDENKEKIQKLMKVLTSPEAKKFIEEKYEGAIVPAF